MSLRVGVLIFVVATAMVIGFGISGVAQPNTTQPDVIFSAPEDLDADEVRIDIVLHEDGSAAWTVEFWILLDGEESEAAFESMQEDMEDDPDAFTREFAHRIDDTIETASEATGREMAADDYHVESDRESIARTYGVVRYSFQWDGFAVIDEDELQGGDAIEGLFLDDGTRVLMSWPDEYELASAIPEPDDQRENAVIWSGGDTEFVSGEPRVVVTPVDPGPGYGLMAIALGALAILAMTAGWWLRRRSKASEDESSDRPPTPSLGSPESGAPSEEQLLSNEEQVLRLLEANDGRLKQQQVVEELEWTDAKTSKVVGNLREEGSVESFRLGRENVLRLPDETQGDDTNEASNIQ